MKRALALLLSLLMVFSTMTVMPALATESIAYPSTQQVNVDGTAVEFQMYALKDASGNSTNYVKVRDLALALNGTKAQFSVEWNGAVNLVSGTAYTPNGSENSTPFAGERAYSVPTSPTNVNGSASDLAAITLSDENGGGYTYYKLRDLGAALGFTVDWASEKGVFIETETQAPAAEAVYPVTLYALDGRTCEVPSNQAEAYLAAGWYYSPVTTLYAADGSTYIVPVSEVDAYLAVGLHRSLDDIKVTLYEPYGNTLSVMPNEVDSYLSVGWYRSVSEAAAHAVPFDPTCVKLLSFEFYYYNNLPSRIGIIIQNTGPVPISVNKVLTYENRWFWLEDGYSTDIPGHGSRFLNYELDGREPSDYILATWRTSGYGKLPYGANGNKGGYLLEIKKQGSGERDFTYSVGNGWIQVTE